MEIDKENDLLIFNAKEFEIEDTGNGLFRWEVDIQELMLFNFSTKDFPDNIFVQSHSSDGFGTFLFHEIEFYKSSDKIEVVFQCRQPNKYWEGKYGLSTLLVTLGDVVKDYNDFQFDPKSLSIDDDWKNIEFSFLLDGDFSFGEKLNEYSALLIQLVKRAELILSGAYWRKEYETYEKLFCTEIIFPLLRKMDFVDIRFNHGVREYGKDFTFSELTKFGNLRHFAIQTKAGNLKGSVNAQIDEIIGQLNDAFAMPYYEVSANETRNISTFIIAISGHFTENAKDKIIQKKQQENTIRDWAIIDTTLKDEYKLDSIKSFDDRVIAFTSQRWERIMFQRDGKTKDTVLTTQNHLETWKKTSKGWLNYDVTELGGELYINGKTYKQ